MTDNIFIQTPRLYVRTWRESDLLAIHAVLSNPAVQRYTGEKPYTIEDSRALIVWARQHCLGWEPGYFNCPLILRENDQVIGRVGLKPFMKTSRIPEIEWTLAPEHWRKGYAAEIGRAIFSYAFEQAGFSAVMGFALPGDAATRGLMDKLGMRCLGNKGHNGQVHCFYRIDAPSSESSNAANEPPPAAAPLSVPPSGWSTARLAEFEQIGRSGKPADVDFLMAELESSAEIGGTKLVDYALGLVSKRAGRLQIKTYLYQGTPRQRNYAALYFKRRGNTRILKKAVDAGLIDAEQAFSK
jgi:RimJ/RimL family protein N-acetyltransferase